ncbi:MAG: DUF86 domain-containing protein [Prevotella sp.]|jgi:uncharacterized protein with HEPN domain|uniref:HepT-like ribonuclease domain-containing protein n=1 Tax=Prevotella sp. tf2-5 TaxID=1761889 RepID=UPI0008F1F77F|nr:HepT-like ribonuclease domain-containing protein [Prevotella sp. tf2-5]MBR2243976.1 DUF86 domain-containing protein [Prevotella sp.]SFO74412.1 Uncharacterized conserved protein, contains HEPN domain [Prevotella sp. tf2-5]
MFDKEIVLDSLQKMKAMLDLIKERTAAVKTANDFLCSSDGMMRLDAICMNLIALGEAVKGLDKQTGGQLLKNYPEVYWKGVMGIRDKISHHYFEIDTDVVFQTLEEDIPHMTPVVEKMISDIE